MDCANSESPLGEMAGILSPITYIAGTTDRQSGNSPSLPLIDDAMQRPPKVALIKERGEIA